MATLYPIWRGSLTYHDGTLSFDGAAIYRGTLQGEDDPAPDAIAGVSVGLKVAGIEEGQAGMASLIQRAKPTGISQFAAGANKLTSRAKAIAIADGAQGDPATTTKATVATMGDLLAMGAADMSTQITLAGLDAGIIGTAGVRTRLGTGGLQPDAIETPTIQQLLATTGFDLGAMGSHKTMVRQTIGDLSDGQQGDQRLKTKLAQAATVFTGAMGSHKTMVRQTIGDLSDGQQGDQRLKTKLAQAATVFTGAMGSHKTMVRQTIGDLSDGQQGDQRLKTKLAQAATVFTGAMGSHKTMVRQTIGDLSDGQQGDQRLKTKLAQAATVFTGAMGSHKTMVRQTIGDLSDGQQGDQRLKTKLAQAATVFTGAMGTPIAKYAQIIYPTAPALPAATMPAMTITLTHSALAAPLLSPITTRACVGVRGIDAGAFGSTKVHRLPLPSPATRDLLPPSATRLEHLTAATLASNLTPELITSTRFADTCPAPLLPWLAWARSVDWWELAESEDQQRALISASFRLHQRKGTPWAIKEALAVLGFGDSTIIERATGRRYDGTLAYNGNEPHGNPSQWAVYRVILARPVTTVQANRIRRLLAEMAPARCHLAALDYTQAPITYNGAATYNGNYNHGAS